MSDADRTKTVDQSRLFDPRAATVTAGVVKRRDVENAGTRYQQRTETPSMMISFDDIFTSTLAGYEECTECFDVSYGSSKTTNPDAATAFASSSAYTITDIEVNIRNQSYYPVLLTKLAKAEVITEIVYTKLINVADLNLPAEVTVFANNYIQRIEYKIDHLSVTFKTGGFIVTSTQYGQDGGDEGNAEMTFDFIHGEMP